jgi:hypothetical protein
MLDGIDDGRGAFSAITPNRLRLRIGDLTTKSASRLGRSLVTTVLLGGLLLAMGPGCDGDEGIGDPCVPEREYDENFVGGDLNEAVIESNSFQCRTRVCLANHFRGRVTCPYGQNKDGQPPPGGKACTVPGTDTPIVGEKENGEFVNTRIKSQVDAQCLDRTADKTVYCSCRCADINGQRPSNQTFCDCPDGFTCEQLVSSTGLGNEGLTGSYCIKNNTKFDRMTACSQGECDRNDKNRHCAGDPE